MTKFVNCNTGTPFCAGEHYTAIITGIIGLGVHPDSYQGTEKPPKNLLKFVFLVPSVLDDDGQPMQIAKNIKVTPHEKGLLYQIFKAVDKSTTVSSLKRLVLQDEYANIIGKCVDITIDTFQNDKGFDVAVVRDINALHPEVKRPEYTGEPVIFSFDAPDLNVFKTLKPFTQSQIISAINAVTLPDSIHQTYAELEAERVAAQEAVNQE